MARKPSAVHDESIGARLRRLRLERGLSQRELAAPGVSYAYISRIEAGTRQPSVKALRRLAGKLGVSADYLETGTDLSPAAARELRLTDLELAVRLGEADGADQALRELLDESLAAGDGSAALRARISLALVAKERGDFRRMVALLEDAVAGQPFDAVHRMELYAQLGIGYVASGRPKLAVALFERCLEAVRAAGGAPALEIRYATLLGYALDESGDLARAAEVVGDALEREGGSGDPTTHVRLHWSLARLAHADNRPDLALANARKAIALLDATDDTFSLARAHLLAASIMITREEGDAAAHHLDAAERLLGPAPSFADAAMLGVRRAQAAALRGEGAVAVQLARETLAALGEELPAERGAALHALGDGLALEGVRDEAETAYAGAVELLDRRRRGREAAQARAAWARLLREDGREEEALAVLEPVGALASGSVPTEPRSDR